MSTPRLFISQLVVEQKIFWRNRSGVFFTFVFPLLLLFFFGSFSDAEILVSGIAALVIVSTTFQSLAISLAFHRDQGVLKRIMATPLSPAMLIAGKVASISLVAILEVAIVVAAGVGVYDLSLPASWAWFAVCVLLGVLAFSALGLAVASLIPNGDSAPAITNAIYLPMMFVSGVFYPVDAMPQALQWLAHVLPLSHLVTPLRDAWLHGNVASDTPLHLAALVAWGAAGAVWANRRFRWQPSFEH